GPRDSAVFAYHASGAEPLPGALALGRARARSRKTMKIIIHDDNYILFYPFTLGKWLTTEVRRCMRSAKRSKRQQGKNRTLRIVLFTNTRAKKPCVHRFGLHKGVLSWMVHIPYIGGGWSEPKAYAEPVRQWLQGIAFVLRKCHLDSSRFEQRIPALLDEFCS